MPYQRTKKVYIFFLMLCFCIYILYICLSDIYPFLPPFVGVLFMIFYHHYDDEQFYIPIFILFALFFYEFDKSLVVGIMPCVFFIVYWFIVERLESALHVNMFFIPIYVCAVYLFYVGGMVLSNLLFQTPILNFTSLFLYYIIFDCLASLLYYYIWIKE